jgi:uncharacterized membrane protein YfcA
VHELLVFGAAMVAGAINSVAGGGTLISFPTLIWLGIPSIPANATNTVALWPGSLGSVWGYRREMRGLDTRVWALVLPSVIGGLAGAVLLYRTPSEVFDRLVPVLILFATVLFMMQEPLQRRFNLVPYHEARSHWFSWVMFFQLLVGLYGGYFGAGIGILMLASLGILGMHDIHEMNALKTVLSALINLVATTYFIFSGLIVWPEAAVMTVAATVGYFAASHYAQRVPQNVIRAVAAGIGLAISAWLLWKQFA